MLGCGMIGHGVIAAASLHRGATVIATDLEDAATTKIQVEVD